MKRFDKKRGQLELSFGMIFSIILIIVFISAAIYGIIKLIEWQNDMLIEKFLSKFQDDVNSIWKNQIESSESYNYTLPSKVTKICFKEKGGKNVFLYSDEDLIELKSKNVENLNMPYILKGSNEKCFDGNKGKFMFIIEKPEGEFLINVR